MPGTVNHELVAQLVHELRNPLASIQSWMELLRSGSLDPEKTQRGFDAIERSAAIQLRLVNDLLDYTLSGSGELRLELRALNLSSVLRDAAEALGPACAAKQVELQLTTDDRAGLVTGDAERLRLVIRNLLENAIASSPEGSVVRVALSGVDSRVVLAVSDSGAGLSADMIPHAFDPIRRDPTNSPPGRGVLALGLATARLVAELHGGGIAASSAGPGHGSTFTMQLPLLPAVPPAA